MQEQSNNSREQLLSAARELILNQGYEAVAVRDIADQAGLTTGAIYANFSGKSEILGLLLVEAIEGLAGTIEKHFAETNSSGITAFIDGYLKFGETCPDYMALANYCRHHVHLVESLPRHIQQRVQQADQRVLSILIGREISLEEAAQTLSTPERALFCTAMAGSTALGMVDELHSMEEERLQVGVNAVRELVQRVLKFAEANVDLLLMEE